MAQVSGSSLILVIDDDTEIRFSLQRVLSQRGYDVQTAGTGKAGVELAAQYRPQVVFFNCSIPNEDGMEQLQGLRTLNPHSVLIAMVAEGETGIAVEALKQGAYDYLMKPFHLEKVITITENALQVYQDMEMPRQPRMVLREIGESEGLIGESEPMQQLFREIKRASESDGAVLITGENGAGKELVARSIYRHSYRHKGQFMTVNCEAIPEALIETELFGEESGKDQKPRKGRLELCEGGTLFLDEIGELALPTQEKILHILQKGEFQRVGGERMLKVNVRLIAATSRSLEERVSRRKFREDLFQQLNVIRIAVPALRDRKEDIPGLAEFILDRLRKSGKIRSAGISEEAMQRLLFYRWPGNVRELENMIHHSAVVSRGARIELVDLPQHIQKIIEEQTEHEEHRPSGIKPIDLPPAIQLAPEDEFAELPEDWQKLGFDKVMDLTYRMLREQTDEMLLDVLENAMIERALEEMGGNQVRTARLLGITRATLRKRIEQARKSTH